MRTIFFPSWCVRGIPRSLMLAAILALPVQADGPVQAPLLEIASGLPGKQVRLTWLAELGARYRIEKSSDLGMGGVWSQVALVKATSAAGGWLDPEPTSTRCFYRIMQPVAEVVSISPSLLSPDGGVLVVEGQAIPPGSSLVLNVDGQLVLVALNGTGTGLWNAVVTGQFAPGASVTTVGIVDGTGVTIVTLNQPLTVSATGLALDGIASLPPAAPVSLSKGNPIPGVGIVVKHNVPKGSKRTASGGGGVDDDCDDSDSGSSLLAIWAGKKGYDYYQAHSQSNSASLLAFWLGRKGYQYYRAKSDMNASSSHSNPYFKSNDHAGEMPARSSSKLIKEIAYARNKHPDLMKREMGPGAISPAPSGLPGEVSFQFCALSLATPAGPPLEMIHTYRSKGGRGGGTSAGYWESCYDISIEPIPVSAGSSATRVIVNDGGGRADIFYRQADGTYRCDGMFREGRFNGDTFTLTFADKGVWTFKPLSHPSAAGKIAAIIDCHQLSLTCAYDGAGRLETVSSAFGQRLMLSRGSDGSLSSVADQTGRLVSYTYCGPQDPAGSPGDLKSISAPKVGPILHFSPTVFTYSAGQKVPALNGNLLSITDGAGHLLEAFTYAATSSPSSIDFDTCASHNRYTGHVTLNRREIRPPGSSPASAYTVFEVDEVGRLTETDFDPHHRGVAVREFTGFCTPGTPVTSQSNRPTGKLHASDPDFFETTCAYNTDSRCTRITRPDGSQELTTYDRDFRKDCPVRERGNTRVMTLRAPGGEERSVTCDYLPDFGTPECACPDGMLSGERKGWDGSIKGNFTRAIGGGYTPFAAEECDDAGTRKGWDGSIKGNRKGWDGSIKGNLAKASGGGHTPFEAGDCDDAVTRKGWDGSIKGNRKGWDGSIKGRGHATRMVNAYGQVSTFGYNASGDCIGATSPVAGRGSLYSYNANGQLTSCSVLNGASPAFTDECVYDAAGFLSSVVSDPAGLHITTSFERDNLGLVTRVVDPMGNDFLYQYNAFDECVQIQSPAMPNRISMRFTTDASGRVCRCDVEHRGPDGSLVSANPVYSTFFVHDERGNLVRVASEELPVNSPPGALAPAVSDLASYDVCDITRDNAGQVIRLSTPAACRNQAADLACDFTYNERGLLDRCIEGGLGTASAVTTAYEYDSARAVVRCALVLSGIPSPQSLVAYDGFHRLSSTTDPMGNVVQYIYENDGSVTTSVYGELNDVPGSAGNVLLSRATARLSSEDLNDPVCLQLPGIDDACYSLDVKSSAFFTVETEDDTITVERFTPNSTAPPATEVTVIDRSPAGLVQQIRCNGDVLANISHDAAGRPNTCSNGACSRSVTRDANGRVLVCGDTNHFSAGGIPGKTFTVTRMFDALGRCTQITDGVGNTTQFAFDSLGRCVSETEPGGLVIQTAYDGASSAGPYSSRVSADMNGDGIAEILSFSLIRCGELYSTTDSNGFTTTFTNDALGRCVRCDCPDGTFQSTSFDSRGIISREICPDGSTRDFISDASGRVTSVVWSNLPQNVVAVAQKTLSYDGLGNLTRCVQGTSTITATYDSCGDQTSETENGLTFSRNFNQRGRTRYSCPDGSCFAERRNAFGQLISVSAITPNGQEISPPVVSLDYMGHQVCRSVQGNGVTTAFTFRADGEASPAGQEDRTFGACVRELITNTTSDVLSDKITARDSNQRKIRCDTGFSVAGQVKTRRTVTSRDLAGNVSSSVISRRDSATSPPVVESSVSYIYVLEASKRMGRSSEIRNGVTGTYTRNSSLPPGDLQMGQYSTWPGGGLTWDDNGNIATFQKGTSQLAFVHDAEGKLVSVNDPATGPVITYNYDARGRRSGRSPQTGGVATRFVYDGSVCIQELGTDNLADTTFVCAQGVQQCIFTRDGSVYYPHGGGGGLAREVSGQSCPVICPRTSLVTNGSGSPVERFDCDDAGLPIFLDAVGSVRPGATAAIGPVKWLAQEGLWEPTIGMFLCPGSIYSPTLGETVSMATAKEPKNTLLPPMGNIPPR